MNKQSNDIRDKETSLIIHAVMHQLVNLHVWQHFWMRLWCSPWLCGACKIQVEKKNEKKNLYCIDTYKTDVRWIFLCIGVIMKAHFDYVGERQGRACAFMHFFRRENACLCTHVCQDVSAILHWQLFRRHFRFAEKSKLTLPQWLQNVLTANPP